MNALLDYLAHPETADLVFTRDGYGRRFAYLDSPLAAQDGGLTHAYEEWLDEREPDSDPVVDQWLELEARHDAQERAFVARAVDAWERAHPLATALVYAVNMRCRFTPDDRAIIQAHEARRGQVELLAARLFQRGYRTLEVRKSA